ncbi:MAG: FecR domain-containing protein [Bacteroidota bacterium]
MINEPDINVASLVASESFQAYCLKTDSPEGHQWSDWISSHPESRPIIEEARNMVIDLHLHLSEEEISAAYAQFSSRAKAAAAIKKFPPFRRWAAIAATFLLLAAGTWAFLQWSTPTYSLAVTQYGDPQEVRLPDGSHVMLNANSQLKWAESWSEENIREVWLEGEAYFEVTHNPEWPFLVHTSAGDIRVLGTSFNAKQRKKALSVALVEGKVRFEQAGKASQILKPGEELSWKGGSLSIREVDMDPILAWSQGKMIFRNASIASIIERLEDDFGWQVSVEAASILEKKVNASIDENIPEVLLEALAAIYDLRFEKKGPKTYIIR